MVEKPLSEDEIQDVLFEGDHNSDVDDPKPDKDKYRIQVILTLKVRIWRAYTSLASPAAPFEVSTPAALSQVSTPAIITTTCAICCSYTT